VEVARLVAGSGLLGLLPPSQPPVDLSEALTAYRPPGSHVAVARTNHPRRYVALAVDDRGRLLLVGKVARDQAGRAKLRREREQMESFVPFLPEPIRAPTVFAYDDGVLLLEAVTWRPRLVPWHLSEDVAHALGVFFKRTMRALHPMAGAAHGDFAPWNLMLGRDGTWTLLDWEDARADAPPFLDVFHFLVQSNQELLFPRRGAIVNGLLGRGWTGRVIAAYAEGAGIPGETATTFFEQYLKESRSSVDPLAPKRGLMVRRDLARRIEASTPMNHDTLYGAGSFSEPVRACPGLMGGSVSERKSHPLWDVSRQMVDFGLRYPRVPRKAKGVLGEPRSGAVPGGGDGKGRRGRKSPSKLTRLTPNGGCRIGHLVDK
jgi:hypothetical protein